MTASVRSLNVGQPRTRDWAGIGRTSIWKEPLPGPVRLGPMGFSGDQVSDTKHHGGVDQAVYVFSREDLDRWVERLGAPIRDGLFGENLTTVGIDVNAAELGEQWRVGTALLEVRSVRTPCNDFKGWMGENGFDTTGWVKRFAADARPGPYLKVVEAGVVETGDPITVEHRPGHGVTASMLFRALMGEAELWPELLGVPDLVDEARERGERQMRRTGVNTGA